VHDAVDVVGVKRKEGEQNAGNAHSPRTAPAVELECILYVAAYVGSGYFRVALGFGALPALCRVISDCSFSNDFRELLLTSSKSLMFSYWTLMYLSRSLR
jgi:hypothetical protein